MAELGKFELPVLAAVARLQGNAYGISVMDEVSKRAGREIGYGTIHVTLSRLERKGFLSSKMGEPSAERGGRRKRFYEVTGEGRLALAESLNRSRATFAGLGKLLPKAAGEGQL
ncbi:PadR family transcriptional regulator [uncultured Methylovirgula sp.]|uniref:PadR family transcriptional regulator n=1 Tax=uncultured Methylovirgula sp. TaxID=1285960 RepID=UPI00262FFA1F|nr:PadR family transcriptional regulator [uncultured Methylovirgula sp.]